MAVKPYPQHEEKPTVLEEPAVAYGMKSSLMNVYQVTDAERESIMRTKEQYARGEYYTEGEMDKMVEEWCRPFTKDELNRWMDEVEADDEADDLLASEEVFAEMEGKYPWLCK